MPPEDTQAGGKENCFTQERGPGPGPKADADGKVPADGEDPQWSGDDPVTSEESIPRQ